MTDCLFCKIISGQIPAVKVYEDDHVFAFLDIKPVNPGHTLVVPKKHFSDLLDADPDTLSKMIMAMQKMARAMVKALGLEAFNIGQNNGRIAGQLVDHLHFHLIPRAADDGLRHWPGKPYASDEEAETVAKKLRQHLNS